MTRSIATQLSMKCLRVQNTSDMELKEALVKYCLRLGDNAMILGHRMSEWSSNGPILEEDIALSNIGLDLFGQCRMMFSYAAELEGDGKTEDDWAYRRPEREFYNVLLVEQPNGHFGTTIARQLLFSLWAQAMYRELMKSNDQTIAAFAANCGGPKKPGEIKG